MDPGREVRVATLRLRGAAAPALRRGVARALATADLRPPGLAPSAILVVRHLAQPLTWTPGVAPPPRCPPAWERATRASLAELCRRAARPHSGELPADAPAVLFRDRSELVACLARAMVRGGRRAWWWRAVACHLSGLEGELATLLGNEAELLPAVVARLDGWGLGREVLARLDSAQAARLLACLADTHRLGLEAGGGRHGERPRAPVGSLAGGATAAERRTAPSPPATPPPWRPWLPAAEAVGLTPEVEALLGVARVLHERPALARGAPFQRRATAWIGLRRASPPAPGEADGVERRGAVAEAASPPPDGESPQPSHPEPSDGRVGPRSPVVRRLPPPPGAARRQSAPAAPPPPVTLDARDGGDAVGAPPAPALAAPAPAPAVHPPAATPRSREGVAEIAEQGVVSELAGVLYLVNLLRHLDLPESAEGDWRLASRVGAWGTLEIVARTLLAPQWSAVAADPLWALLAALDGRRGGEPAGWQLRSAPAFRLPAAAWRDLAAHEGAPRWAAAGRELVIWHDGVVLHAGPRRGASAASQVERELRRFGDLGARPARRSLWRRAPLVPCAAALPAGAPPAVRRWARAAGPWLRRRLLAALPADDATAPDPVAALLRVPGRLFVTATHLDCVLALERIHLGARLAGLDRDPGWCPDFGRVILFHFE